MAIGIAGDSFSDLVLVELRTLSNLIAENNVVKDSLGAIRNDQKIALTSGGIGGLALTSNVDPD